MSLRILDLADWPRAARFRLFRSYDRPHFAVTARVDATRLMAARKPTGVSAYRASAHAVGAAIHAVPELRMRFRGDIVTEYDRIGLAIAVPLADGTVRHGEVVHDPDYARFAANFAAAEAQAKTDAAAAQGRGARDDLVYLSCLPWLDYTALDSALTGPDDCIPRVCWGRIGPSAAGHDMAMTLQCHQALVDGFHVARFFSEVERVLNAA